MIRMLLKVGIVLIFLFGVSNFIPFLEKQTGKITLSNPNTKKSIVIIGKLNDGDYWQSVKMGAEAAGKEYNVNVTYLAPQTQEDVMKQIDLIQQSYQQGMDALIYAASDDKTPSEEITKISKNHIPVISIDSKVDSSDVLSFIGADIYKTGFMAGEKILELAGMNANIAIMSSEQGGGNELEKEKGLKDSIDKHPEARIVDTEYCNSNQKLAEELTKKMIASNKRIGGIVALDVISSVGVAKEIKKLGLDDKIKVITFDSSEEVLGLIQDGAIQATIIQNPFLMGYLSVKYAENAINGVKIPRKVNIDTHVINLDNMFWTENEKLLFPFVS
jgi:ribose transport system substrate-binding protein